MLLEKVYSCHVDIKRNQTKVTLTFFSFFLFLPAEKQSLDQSAEPAINTEQRIVLWSTILHFNSYHLILKENLVI